MNVVSTAIYISLVLCVVLGAVYLRIWLSRRDRLAYLYFSICSFMVSAYGVAELNLMRSPTVDEYLFALRWGHIPALAALVSIALFIRHFLNAGHAWILWVGISLRSIHFLINFVSPWSVHFTEITEMKQAVLFGEPVFIAVGTRNPAMLIGHLGTLCLLVYCVDAARAVWRRGDLSTARWAGVSTVFFLSCNALIAILVMWGLVQVPLFSTPFFAGVLLVMGYRLTIDVINAGKLAEQLEQEKHQTQDVRRELEDAETAVKYLGAKLIGAQEAERARLGRELHDDLSQRLALLSIELEKLHRASPDVIDDRIEELSESIQMISSDVHRISHELHPAKLEQLGLAAALRGFCREIGEARDLDIELRCDELPRSLSPDVALCVYRLVQEALQNIAKHSEAEHTDVVVDAKRDVLLVRVSDNGKGFDTGNRRMKESLGFVSMRERLVAVGGTFLVVSKIGKGTTISATIPFKVGSSANQ